MKIITEKVFILILCLIGVSCDPTSEERELFLAAEQDRWFRDGTANWNWNGSEIIGESQHGSSFLMTNDSYKNFEFSMEFFPDSTVNSGIFIRCREKKLSAEDCFEFNIWDLHPNQGFRTGALVGKQTPLNFVETLNRWNTYLIKAQGNKLEAWINGVKTVDYTDEHLIEGYVAIQAGELGNIRFRNIKIKSQPR